MVSVSGSVASWILIESGWTVNLSLGICRTMKIRHHLPATDIGDKWVEYELLFVEGKCAHSFTRVPLQMPLCKVTL